MTTTIKAFGPTNKILKAQGVDHYQKTIPTFEEEQKLNNNSFQSDFVDYQAETMTEMR